MTFPNKYGVYIVDSTVTAANSTIAPIIYHRCALGRPWNSQMRSIFANTYMDASILPTGFIDWNPSRYDNLTLQAEFENFGPGFNASARAASLFDVQLTRAQWSPYSSPADVFQFPDTGAFGNDAWVDYHA
jgi:pectin methylesterase-like acyl-CoA thioesterase